MKNFDGNKTVESLPFIIGNNVNSIEETNQKLKELIDEEIKMQRDIFRSLGKVEINILQASNKGGRDRIKN